MYLSRSLDQKKHSQGSCQDLNPLFPGKERIQSAIKQFDFFVICALTTALLTENPTIFLNFRTENFRTIRRAMSAWAHISWKVCEENYDVKVKLIKGK